MNKQKLIVEKLKNLGKPPHYMTSAILEGEVKTVHDLKTIDIEVDGLLYYDVLLQAIEEATGSSILVVPKVGSKALIGNIENGSNYVLLHADKAERILLKQDDGIYIDVLHNVIKLNGDSKGGLVQIQELKDNIDSLKNYIEAMNTSLPSAFNAILSSTSANGALGATAYQTAMAGKFILVKDMENQNVKHG